MSRAFYAAVIIVACVLFAAPARAAGEAMAFMQNGAGARSLGFGNAGTGAGGDNDSVVFNPAGLVLIPDLQFSFETYIMSFGRVMNYVSASKPFLVGENKFSSAVSWLGYSPGSGLELRRTDTPEPEGSFSDSSNLFILSAATSISQRLSAGVNMKLMVQNLYTARATGLGFDAGFLLKPSRELGIGINVADIGASIGWSNNPEPEKLPLKISAGASYTFFSAVDSYIMPAFDIVTDTDGYVDIRGGVESFLFNSVYLRAGYDRAFCFGAGIFVRASRVFTVKVNYALKFDTILTGETNHRIGAVLDYVFPHKSADSRADEIREKKGAEGYDW